jgi:CubicO group peptidase (beta-lactamase class C family)
MPQRPQTSRSPNALKEAIQNALFAGQWVPFLRQTTSTFGSRAGTAEERALIFLLRCQGAKMLHDRREFERSLSAYQREIARLTPERYAEFQKTAQTLRISMTYQDARYRPRPLVVMPPAEAQQRGLDVKARDLLRKKARSSCSEGVYIWQNGKTVLEDYFDAPQEPRYIMSCAKPIVAMAIGRLWDTGALKSFDLPVFDFYPEWKDDPRKSHATLRHLLTHTAGIPNQDEHPNLIPGNDPAAERDMVTFARKLSLFAEPGTQWSYSNLGFILLGDIVKKVSGKRLGDFMQAEFFAPMEISEWEWRADPGENVEAHGHLSLRPHDFVKFSILMLEQGMWKGRRLLSEAFAKESLRDQTHRNGVRIPDAPKMGLAWNIETRDRNPKVVFGDKTIQTWRKVGVPEGKIAKMRPYKGEVMPIAEYTALTKRLYGVGNLSDGAAWSHALGTLHYPSVAERVPAHPADTVLTAFFHTGLHGQYLLGLPARRLAAVRHAAFKDLSALGQDANYLSFLYDAAAIADKRALAPTPMLLID